MEIKTSRRKRGLEFKLKVGPKNQNFQFKLKFSTKDNSRNAELNGDVHFFSFPKMPFLNKFGP